LDRLIIIPSSIPPHKAAGKLVSAEHRLEMCNLAFGSDPKVTVSPIEIERSGKSYTVDTLRELKKFYPDDELFFIFGSDMLETFNQWYRWEEILSLCFLCAASRENGFVPNLSVYTEEQRKKIIFLEIEPFEVSSTQVRTELVKNEESSLIPREVLEYINQNNLYDDGLKEYRKLICEKLDDARIFHSECVSESAAALAEKYGADAEKARLAGLLHDVMKNASKEEHFEYIHEPALLRQWLEQAGFCNITIRQDGPQHELGRLFLIAENRKD
jgi:nicotinate-nucleotide adenylyltransferase